MCRQTHSFHEKYFQYGAARSQIFCQIRGEITIRSKIKIKKNGWELPVCQTKGNDLTLTAY